MDDMRDTHLASTHLNGSDTLTKDLVMDSDIFIVLFAIEVKETSNVIILYEWNDKRHARCLITNISNLKHFIEHWK